MREISSQELDEYRTFTFRLHPSLHIQTREEAVSFVKERGFIFFWSIKGIVFPSLWSAAVGDRPPPDIYDDAGQMIWGWKDALLGSKQWYYAKVLRKRSTMISLDLLPDFYALSENYGSFEEDYLTLYEQGRLTREARQIYEALLEYGVLDTVALRRKTHLSSYAGESWFTKAITDLQSNLMILPVGVTESGAWHYAFAYDITARHFPELPDIAHKILEDSARIVILRAFSCSLGVFRIEDPVRLLGWGKEQVLSTINALVNGGDLVHTEKVAGVFGDFFVDKNLYFEKEDNYNNPN